MTETRVIPLRFAKAMTEAGFTFGIDDTDRPVIYNQTIDHELPGVSMAPEVPYELAPGALVIYLFASGGVAALDYTLNPDTFTRRLVKAYQEALCG